MLRKLSFLIKKRVIIFAKSFVVDIQLGSKNAFASGISNCVRYLKACQIDFFILGTLKNKIWLTWLSLLAF